MPLRLAAALASLLALAACDAQAPPPRTNPYDPDFAGIPTATSPSDLALASATTTTATLSWTDRSSFETGVRVERAGPQGTFETVATLPPDATRFTDEGLTASYPLTYRVTALTAGGADAAPSAPLRIRYPADTLDLATVGLVGIALPEVRISPDGERLYTRDGSSTRITSLRTGAALGTIPRVPDIVGFLAEGRLAFRENTSQPFTIGVRFFDGPVPQTLATLRFPENGCFGIGGSTTVSADGRRIADLCGDAVLVWTLPSDVPLRIQLPFIQPRRVTFSPDGARLVAETSGSTNARLTVIDAEQHAIVWEAQNVQETSSGNRFALSADGTVMAYATGGRIRVVDPASGAVRVEAATGRNDGVIGASTDAILVSGYDAVLQATATRVLRASDLSLVRTLPAGTYAQFRFVPGGLLSVVQAGGRLLAVRTSFPGVWEAAGGR